VQQLVFSFACQKQTMSQITKQNYIKKRKKKMNVLSNITGMISEEKLFDEKTEMREQFIEHVEMLDETNSANSALKEEKNPLATKYLSSRPNINIIKRSNKYDK
jgi:predicted CopG family antitoxin